VKSIFTSILIAVSILMLDVRVGICRVPAAPIQQKAEETSTQQQSQSGGGQATTAPQANATQVPPAKLDDKARKIKRTVEKIGVGGRLTLYLRNGDELYGSVVSLDDESLQVTEVDLKQVLTIQYRNVKKVREDYGKRDIFTRKRTNPPRGFKIGAAVAALFLAVGLPIIALASMKD
jgi:hypothetical protein